MSPLILALLSWRGVERRWRLPNGAIGFGVHQCPPRCGHKAGWACGWQMLQERPR